MNKLTIPAILVATVMVAGIFAFMPVEKASTVHDTIILAITDGKVVQVTVPLSEGDGTYVILDVSDVTNGIESIHIAATLPDNDGNNSDCTGDDIAAGVQILAGVASTNLDNILGAGLEITNTGLLSVRDFSGDVDMCIFHGDLTLAELQAIDATHTTITDIAVVIPADIDTATPDNQANDPSSMITVTAVLEE